MAARIVYRMLRVCVLALVCISGQGCLIWRYTTTPPVSGTAIDATTREPLAGARVGFRGRERKSTQTIADGSFVLRSDHSWGPAVIIPFEFTPCGGMFFVEASGYATFERDIGP